MSITIEIRNVPVRLYRAARARAALEGMSLSDLALRALEREAARPTLAEIAAKIRRLPKVEPTVPIATMVREERDCR